MAKVYINVKDSKNIKIGEYSFDSPLFDDSKKGTKYNIYLREQGYQEQYTGTHTVKETLPVTPTPTCPDGQHWDSALGKCVPNVVTPPTCPPNMHWDATLQKCVEDVVTPPPTTGAKYDSNIQGKWNNGIARFVTSREGIVTADGYGFTVNASGGGGFRIDGKGQGNLEPSSSGHRRIYICCCNYNARLEGEFIFLDSKPRNFSIKTRNRHQYEDEVGGSVPNTKKQGGLGLDFSIEDQEVGHKVEVYHGENMGSVSKALPKNLEVGKWYAYKFTYKDKSSSEIDIKVELDYKDGNGFRTVLSHVAKPPSQFFNKADFDTWSQFWLRLNDEGKIGNRNVRLFPL